MSNPKLDATYYAQGNYQRVTLALETVCEKTFLDGHHVVPGAFERAEKKKGGYVVLKTGDRNTCFSVSSRKTSPSQRLRRLLKPARS